MPHLRDPARKAPASFGARGGLYPRQTQPAERGRPVKRTALPSIAAAILAALALAANAAAGAPTNPKHFFWANGQASPDGTVSSLTNDLIYHGGAIGDGAIGVETKPAVYLVYWGPEWAKG